MMNMHSSSYRKYLLIFNGLSIRTQKLNQTELDERKRFHFTLISFFFHSYTMKFSFGEKRKMSFRHKTSFSLIHLSLDGCKKRGGKNAIRTFFCLISEKLLSTFTEKLFSVIWKITIEKCFLCLEGQGWGRSLMMVFIQRRNFFIR